MQAVDWAYYLTYGNGDWMNGWHSSGEDAYAMMFRATCCIYMSVIYFRYANQWKKNFRGQPDSPTKRHGMLLRHVFLWGLAIHLVGSVVFIVAPVHYVMGILFLINGVQCHLLCRSNLLRMAHDRWLDGERALTNEEVISRDLETVGNILAQQQHAAAVEMVNDTSRMFCDVRDALEMTRARLEQSRNSKVSE